MRNLKSIAFWCGSLSIAAVFEGAATAQQPAHSDTGQLEEITVTAEKRESTVQTTPISLTAVSGADIEARGVTDLGTLLQAVPGVSIRTSGPGLTEFEMRGIASTGGNSPTVGFYYDDTPLTAPADTNEGKIVISPALYDLNRVEVLRGPQGTLYGSGSMGGTIKVVPNAPDPSGFDASAEQVLGDTDHGGFDYAENAMVNLPFGAGLAAVRIVGSYSHDSGWIDRIVAAPGAFPLPTSATMRGDVLAAPVAEDYKDVNDVDRTTVRVSALIKPIDGLSIAPSFFYQKLTSGGLPYIDSDPGTDAHYQPFDVAEPVTDDFKLGSLNLKYTMDFAEISSSTSYWTRHEPVVQDTSESWQTGIGLTAFLPADGGLGAAYAIENNHSHQTSEELRIASVGDGPIKWLAGYFYEDFYSNWLVDFPSQGGAALFGSNDLFNYINPTKILQQSGFGEVTYNILPELAVTAGLRRYYYNESADVTQSGSLTSGLSMTSSSAKDQGVTPKFSISYDFDKDLLVYATAAKGFRPGGGTGPVPTSGEISCEAALQAAYGTKAFVPGPTTFQPDHVWSYELGEKLSLADNRITINAAAYFESWVGVQQTNALSCGYIYTANAGNAHVYGGELEINAILVKDLVLGFNTGYTHAALVSSDLLNSGFSPGTAIQDDPRWTGSASLTYRHALTDQFAFTARADTNYVGNRTDETLSINTVPSYQLSNLRSGLEGKNWSAVLFINNIADKRALLNNVTEAAENLATYNRVTVSQPRTAGIDLNYRFGR